jgi:hypothetical protein
MQWSTNSQRYAVNRQGGSHGLTSQDRGSLFTSSKSLCEVLYEVHVTR